MSAEVISRRTFMKMACSVTAAALLPPVIPVSAMPGFEEVTRGKDGSYYLSKTAFLMGTYVTISASGPSQDLLQEASSVGFDEIRRLIPVFNRFDSSSALSQFNAQGHLGDAPKELLEVSAMSRQLHEQSLGSFDVTILPALKLMETYAGNTEKLASAGFQKELKERLALVDGSKITISRNGLSTSTKEMALTFDGIGKGYILDAAAAVMKNSGVTNFLINGGGDMIASGVREKGRPWTVAVENPLNPSRPYAVVKMNNEAIATSGGYEVFFDSARVHHHIVDPRFGICPDAGRVVSVRASSVALADAYATMLCVLGPREGLRLADGVSGVNALFAGKQKRMLKTSGWV
ncbi:MAG: FAD:protein FMN transferase [Desulfovibrio sp.]